MKSINNIMIIFFFEECNFLIIIVNIILNKLNNWLLIINEV